VKGRRPSLRDRIGGSWSVCLLRAQPEGARIAQEGSALVVTVPFWTCAGPRELRSRGVVID
jgi:hypothetical protein